MTITKDFERFHYFNFKTFSLYYTFLKLYFFKKTGVLFLLQSISIENEKFPYKTALSKTNVKANRMESTKLTFHKEQNFTTNSFIFLKL